MKRTILLVDEDLLVLKSLQRSLRRLKPDWKALHAQSHQDALDLYATESIDILITEVHMGKTGGKDFFNAFKAKHPSAARIILTGYTNPNEIFKYAGLAHQLLAKPWNDQVLFDTIERADVIHRLFSNERLKDRLNAIETLPNIPSIYLQVSEKLKHADASIQDVSDIIISDPSLTIKLLQIVNSPFYGLPMPVVDPSKAVSLLGLDMIKGIVLTSGLFSQYQEMSIKTISIDEIWRHSLETANIVRQISRFEKLGKEIAEASFTASLLHDVGKIIIASNFPEEYKTLCDAVKSNQTPVWQNELEILGVTHAEIGAYLIGLWGLPLSVIHTIHDHHQPDLNHHNQMDHTALLHVANAFERDRKDTNKKLGQLDINHEFITHLKIEKNVDLWREEIARMA